MDRWKDKYYDVTGVADITNLAYYYSSLGRVSGTGTKKDPILSVVNNPNGGIAQYAILASGYNSISLGQDVATQLIGQDKYNTLLDATSNAWNGKSWQFSDLRIMRLRTSVERNSQVGSFYDCIFDLSDQLDSDNVRYFGSAIRCVFWKWPFNFNRGVISSVLRGIVFVDITALNLVLSQNLNLFESCDINLPDATALNSYKNNYHGFVNCRFKIGAETEYTALTGTTESELRADFKARCVAQGFSVPDVTDYNETLPMGRWVFADKCTFDGYIMKGSIIDNFQSRRFILLGNSGKVVDWLPITLNANTPMSFNPNNPKDADVVLSERSLSLPDTKNLSVISDNRIASGVGLLLPNSLAKLTLLDIVNNLSAEVGVRMASDRAFGSPANSGSIVSDMNYMVRSTDGNEATITYNGVVYSSSLVLPRTNIFRGLVDKPDFTPSANAVCYPVTELAQQSVVELRIVRDLPGLPQKTGALLNKYWYFVGADDISAPIGTINYNGVSYSFGGSFLADAADLTFEIGSEPGNNLHLRRAYLDDYDPNNQADIDYQFWLAKQKPQWIKVIPNDLRCLMENDKLSSEIMHVDTNGNYIASGHPEFYSLIEGTSGYARQPQLIVGRFFQARLNISTFNAL